MKLPTPLLATMEVTLNRILEMDGEMRDELLSMHGKVIKLVITGLDVEMLVIPTRDGVQVMGEYEGDVDVTIRGGLIALMKTAITGDRSAVQEGDIRFDGDVYTGEKFQKILQRLDLDWEEPLARITGDVVAHHIGQTVRAGHQWFTSALGHLLQDTSDYLQEESRDVPAPAEVEIFYHSVDTLRDDTARVAARIRKLERQIEEGTK